MAPGPCERATACLRDAQSWLARSGRGYVWQEEGVPALGGLSTPSRGLPCVVWPEGHRMRSWRTCEVLIPAPGVGSVKGEGTEELWMETSCEIQTPGVRRLPEPILVCFGKTTGVTTPLIGRMSERTCFRSERLNAAVHGWERLIGPLVGGEGKDRGQTLTPTRPLGGPGPLCKLAVCLSSSADDDKKSRLCPSHRAARTSGDLIM